MLTQPNNPQKMRTELEQLIAAIDLPELTKQFLKVRLLEEKALGSLCWR